LSFGRGAFVGRAVSFIISEIFGGQGPFLLRTCEKGATMSALPHFGNLGRGTGSPTSLWALPIGKATVLSSIQARAFPMMHPPHFVGGSCSCFDCPVSSKPGFAYGRMSRTAAVSIQTAASSMSARTNFTEAPVDVEHYTAVRYQRVYPLRMSLYPCFSPIRSLLLARACAQCLSCSRDPAIPCAIELENPKPHPRTALGKFGPCRTCTHQNAACTGTSECTPRPG